MLDVAPDDQLLEIGCGTGQAVSLICPRLDTGAITAIDRSALMITLARQRNHGHVVAGKARLEAVALEDAVFGDAQFTKVFAFNVNVFERRPVHALRGLLLPSGGLYLFFPAATGGQDAAHRRAGGGSTPAQSLSRQQGRDGRFPTSPRSLSPRLPVPVRPTSPTASSSAEAEQER